MISSMLLSRLPGNLDSLYPLLTIYQCQVVRPNEKSLGMNTANHSNCSRCRDVTHLLYFVTPAWCRLDPGDWETCLIMHRGFHLLIPNVNLGWERWITHWHPQLEEGGVSFERLRMEQKRMTLKTYGMLSKFIFLTLFQKV